MTRCLIFTDRQSGAAYRGAWLWLPKWCVERSVIQASLTLETKQFDDSLRRVELWEETATHYKVPREYLTDEQAARLAQEVEILDEQHMEWERLDFADSVVPRDEIQEEAWEALSRSDRGILVLGCGTGKTVLACKKIAQEGVPTIVVANAGQILGQWEAAAREFLSLTDEDIGWVKGKSNDWRDRPLVLATVQTLSSRHRAWPNEFRNYFGLAIFDEVHHISAPRFSKSAPLFYGKRFGLTATPEREDGMQNLYYYHIGRPFHVDLRQPLTPTIVFLRLNTYINLNNPDNKRRLNDRSGEFNFTKFRQFLCELEGRNDAIVRHITRHLEEGRKILALSHVKPHLRRLSARMPRSVVVTGDTPFERRVPLVRDNDLVFATPGVAEEALDDTALDTVLFLTPFRARRALVQGMGRVLREHEGKMDPLVVIIDDHQIPMARGPMRDLRRHIRRMGYDFSIRSDSSTPARQRARRRWRMQPRRTR